MVLLNVKYHNITRKRALKTCVFLAERPGKSQVFFLNLDSLYRAAQDPEYRRALISSDLILPDGIGVKLATRWYGGRMKENCNGTDFSPLFLEALAEKGRTIYLLGGKEGVAEKAAAALRIRFPSIRIVGTHSGYFPKDSRSVITDINQSGAAVLFVGMGVPLQEKWIAENRENLNPRVCLGVGALFDWLSGTQKRSPAFFQKLNLEWFWRVLIEPRRMFKRYFLEDLPFLLKIAALRPARESLRN